MCGISGIVQLSGTPRLVVDEAGLTRMTDVLRHRGPDDRGSHIEPGAAIGVRRLSIIDVAGGHQPFANENATVWAALNGELYNHETIRDELRTDGHMLRSRCDTEVLPHLWERDGTDAPRRLNGDFAFVVWDSERRTALIARDRLGVKPLYYAVSGDLLVFASEIKAVLASGIVDTILDYEAIDAYLTLGFFPEPATPLIAVRKIPAGHLLLVHEGYRIDPYWEFPRPAPDPTVTMGAAVEQVAATLDVAVRDRLMSDVELGAMLSGGLDSTLIVAMMGRATNRPVKTFSVGFVESGAENELGVARRVASALGADHRELELSMTTGTASLEDLVWTIDEPVADLSAIGFEALSRLASGEVTVALAGQGADELFGGYTRHVRAALVGRARRLPSPLVHAGARLLEQGGGRWARFGAALSAPDASSRYLSLRAPYFDDAARALLIRRPLSQDSMAAGRAIARKGAAIGDGDDPLAGALYLDCRLGLVDDMLHYFDRASMAHSLEIRVPFLDHRLVELAARIPAALKVHGRTTKAVLREVARGIVPDEVLTRPKVGFFNSAVEQWIGTQLRGRAREVLLDPNAACRAFVDPRGLEATIDSYSDPASRQLSGEGLYALFMLELWLVSFLPRALEPATVGAGAA